MLTFCDLQQLCVDLHRPPIQKTLLCKMRGVTDHHGSRRTSITHDQPAGDNEREALSIACAVRESIAFTCCRVDAHHACAQGLLIGDAPTAKAFVFCCASMSSTQDEAVQLFNDATLCADATEKVQVGCAFFHPTDS